MNKLLMLTPVGLVAVGILWSATADEPKKADPVKPAEAARADVRWEYATLSTGGRANVHLLSSADDVTAESWSNLAQKLKLTPKGTAYQIAIFDHLGSQGWELVTQTATAVDNRPANQSYTFKRRAK